RATRCTFFPYTTLFRSNLTGTAVSGVGGISLLVFCALVTIVAPGIWLGVLASILAGILFGLALIRRRDRPGQAGSGLIWSNRVRSEEHTSELQSRENLV